MNKFWDFLGSRNLSVYIFITGLTYILFLVAFSTLVPAWWVGGLARLLPFNILYLLFFINLIICEIKWLPVIVRKCRKTAMPVTEEDLQRFRNRIEVQASDFGMRNLEKYLRRRGYRIESGVISQKSEEEKNSVLTQQPSLLLHAHRGRFSPVGNLLFHVSFLFLLAGVFVSANSHVEKNILLMEGQASEYGFELVGIKPEFWKDKLLFTDLMATLRSDRGEELVRLSKAASIGGANITIQGVGYTPKYVLRSLSGGGLDVGYVNLVNFVPGSVDHFSIPGFPYKIYVSIYPDHELRGEKISTKSMNLNNPRYVIKVVRGKTLVYSGTLGLSDEALFDGFGLLFPEIKYNGTFRIIKDKGESFIWAAFMLMGIGLVWKLLFYRRELALASFGNKTYLCLNSDYHTALFLKRFEAVVETGL